MTQRLEAQGKQNPENGHKWDDGSDHDDVTNIVVRGDARGIQYIRFDYVKNEKSKEGSFHGLAEQGFTQTFEINHLNDEQLESVEGYYEPKSSIIQGLQFKTNLRISELMGFQKDCTKFSLAVEGKKIIGFHGSTSMNLFSLGAYFTWISPTKLAAKGGKGGKEWNDGADHEGVTKIYVRGGYEGIQYIKFDYVKNGKQINGPDHGGKGRGFTEMFEINHLTNEYLVSVECYYNTSKSEAIQGIQFKTNIKTSELIGYDDGFKFRLAANGRKIIGFHGYAEKNLNSLGAYFIASPTIKLECRGLIGTGRLWDDGAFEGVRKVYVTYDKTFVWRVTFYYDNGGEIKRLQHGSMDVQEGKFEVDYPNEFITTVEGTLKTSGLLTVASLTFKTSKGRTSSTFGSATNSKFVLESKGCALVGFHGRSTGALEAIGAYFRPLPPSPDTEKVEAKGGDGGASWDDGGFDGVRKIYIGLTENAIAFVKFMYYKDAQMVFGDDHGNKCTLFGVKELELNYPVEYVTSVEGSYDTKSGAITMLRFKTNKQAYPDIGVATTSSFVLHKVDHMIVGFHGKSSNILHQIGVHVIPI